MPPSANVPHGLCDSRVGFQNEWSDVPTHITFARATETALGAPLVLGGYIPRDPLTSREEWVPEQSS